MQGCDRPCLILSILDTRYHSAAVKSSPLLSLASPACAAPACQPANGPSRPCSTPPCGVALQQDTCTAVAAATAAGFAIKCAVAQAGQASAAKQQCPLTVSVSQHCCTAQACGGAGTLFFWQCSPRCCSVLFSGVESGSSGGLCVDSAVGIPPIPCYSAMSGLKAVVAGETGSGVSTLCLVPPCLSAALFIITIIIVICGLYASAIQKDLCLTCYSSIA